MRRNQSDKFCPRPICTRLMLSTPPTRASEAFVRSMIPAASNKPTMLVLHCMIVVNVGTCIEFAFKPNLAGKIGVGKIDYHRTPNREINGPGHASRHCLHDWHRQGQGVAMGERPVHAYKRRANACG